MRHTNSLRLACSFALLAVTVPSLAVTATPLQQTPSNGTSNWLFNSGANFRWSAITGATYRIVISDNAGFNNFNPTTLTCSNAGCKTLATSNAYASPANLSGYWFYGTGTYYWKVRASTPTGGTSSWSPVYSFTTTSAGLRSTVQAALSYINTASPQSRTDTKSPTTWDTDMSSSDGTRHRTAMNRLATFVKAQGYTKWANGGRVITTKLRTDMAADLYTYPRTPYDTPALIVNRMVALYAGTVPASDDGMMALLGYRAQCKEFADRMVTAGGLTARKYNYGVASAYPRPGFYVFNRQHVGNDHAGLVRAVSFTTAGTPQVQMIESNWGAGWTNPKGSVAWFRTIAADRVLTMNGSPYVAIDPS